MEDELDFDGVLTERDIEDAHGMLAAEAMTNNGDSE